MLSREISLAFFVPVIVYMSDAFGTQTETIYVRYLKDHRLRFFRYFVKELTLGVLTGLVLGLMIGLVTELWLGSGKVALTVGLAMMINITMAPLVAILVTTIFYKKHIDPALGAGPFTTVIQDFISLLVYFLVASLIIWKF